MGNQCTTPVSEIVQPSKKSRITVSPLSLHNHHHIDISVNEKLKSYNCKSSAGTSASAWESCSEGTPRIININSPIDTTSNTSPRLNQSDISKPFQYKKGPLIGKGSYGEVNECLNLSSGELLAAKSVKVSGDLRRLRNYIEALRKEIVILKDLSHPNVIRYFSIETTEVKEGNYSQIEIISEYVSGGSIKVLLEKFDKLDERVVSSYTKQILEGLTYLHEHEIVHRNIKSSNVLIDACGTAKLTDFGCFKNFDKFVNINSPEKDYKASILQKTSFCWAAPEVVMKKSQGKPSDIWSVGCVVLEMLTGLLPWKNLTSDLEHMTKLITSGTPPPFPDHISENCKDFLTKIFKFRPEERPTSAELLEHPFIREQLPSLSCLDLDTIQNYQPSIGLRSIDLLQDDIFNDDKCAGTKNTVGTASTQAAHSSVTLCHSNKSIALICTPIKVDSPKLAKQNESEKTNPSKTQDSLFYECNTPIRKAFLSNSSYSVKRSNCTGSNKENIFKDTDNDKILEEDAISHKTEEDVSPLTKEQRRQKFEDEMREELERINMGDSLLKEKTNNIDHNQDEKKVILSKQEIRRKYEQEMEQELIGINVSNFNPA